MIVHRLQRDGRGKSNLTKEQRLISKKGSKKISKNPIEIRCCVEDDRKIIKVGA